MAVPTETPAATASSQPPSSRPRLGSTSLATAGVRNAEEAGPDSQDVRAWLRISVSGGKKIERPPMVASCQATATTSSTSQRSAIPTGSAGRQRARRAGQQLGGDGQDQRDRRGHAHPGGDERRRRRQRHPAEDRQPPEAEGAG